MVTLATSWRTRTNLTLKAAIKGVILVAVYIVLSQFIARLSELVSGLQQPVEKLGPVCIVLMTISELAAGSILQHFFDTAKALFIIALVMLSWQTGTSSLTLHGSDVVINARVFLIIPLMLGLLELAKSRSPDD